MERDTGYFLVAVGAINGETSVRGVERTVARNWFAFGEHAPKLRDSIKADGSLCFYASGVGVVAKARVVEPPHQDIRFPDLKDPQRWSWIVRLDEVKLFLDSPVIIDREMRAKLDAFKDKNLDNWGWFVQSLFRLTEHDFDLLTNSAATKAK